MLSNEKAWKKTHRISAYIWIAFSLIGIVIGLGQEVNVYMVLAPCLPTRYMYNMNRISLRGRISNAK
ncbi:SdpI family protein [Paenibacillus polymyxa]|uniref:SdpI family protein n=1 Tax=Paenibacillus polymyxa TaxID=1406 RepID=UPI002B4124B5|nr:SdpI family protein [Paenibacillus polymyxa]